MTAYDDDTLMRRIDGELTPEQGAAIDAAAKGDPALAARLADMRSLRTLSRDAFPIAPDPRDRDLARLIQASTAARPSLFAGLAQAVRDAFAPRRAAVWGGLATAAFVAGVLIAPALNGSTPTLVADGGRIADAGLIRVLDQRLASQGADANGRAIGLTFQDADGRWCRTFNAAEDRLGGLACRDGDAWTLQALAPLSAPSGEVRTAASDTPAPVLAAVDAALAGDPLDAAAEARARDGGWR